ncbi:MAG: DUF3553 domain-containing protein [Deltaproteobacteria bacterium]|nr:DUF3553 domain-containing protein [Deltaproteobacteria bacterium]
MYKEIRKLYLSVGEQVVHLERPQWGVGKVVEEMNSIIPGGISMVRIEFRNAGLKTFDNNMESLYCCYHAGVRRVG